jgi:hypothetical protein
VPFLLAERARSECARPMRAVKGNLGTPPERDECSSEGKDWIVSCARATRGRGLPSLDARTLETHQAFSTKRKKVSLQWIFSLPDAPHPFCTVDFSTL